MQTAIFVIDNALLCLDTFSDLIAASIIKKSPLTNTYCVSLYLNYTESACICQGLKHNLCNVISTSPVNILIIFSLCVIPAPVSFPTPLLFQIVSYF